MFGSTGKDSKYRLTEAETALVIEGLEAGARENERLAADASRLGYVTQARDFSAKAGSFRSLASLARTNRVKRLTARY